MSDSAPNLFASQAVEVGQALPVGVVHSGQRCAKQRHGNLCFDRRLELSLDTQQAPFKVS